MRTSLEGSGNLRDVDLLAAFVALWRGRTSGSVRFSRGGSSAGFDLSNGEVSAVLSSEPRFATASVLVRAGKLEAAAVERLSVPEGSDAALAALAAGILTKREWRWGEKIRAIEVFSDLLLWPEGRYVFDTGSRPIGTEATLAIPRLLLELFLRSRDRNLIEHQLGSPDAPLLRAPDFEQEFATFGLTADAESVVRLIDGRASAAEISRKSPADPFAVLKLLAALATLGLVRPAQATAETPPPVAPETPPTRRQPAWSTEARDGDVFAEEEEVAGDVSVFPVSPHSEAVELLETSPEAETPATSFDSDFSLPGQRQLSDQTGGPVRRTPLLWLLAILLAATGVILFVRSRAIPRQEAASGRPVPIAATTPPSPVETLVPTVPAVATLAPTPQPTRARPSARAAPTATPAAAGQRRAASGGGNDSLRREWVRRAEHDRNRLASEPGTRFAIQLELACEVPSLVGAWKHDRPAGSMWLLLAPHGGRDCFRVFWGRYTTRDAAIRAKAEIPPFFVTSRNRPVVVAVR
ncbi:MAG: DUF4388 domain-containing protein [Thermoanaerobaculia bacterium]